MIVKVPPEFRDAIDQAGHPLELQDEQTSTLYVLMTREQFRELVYDDSDLTDDEMLAAAGEGLNAPDGWGAQVDAALKASLALT
jgi:hypothetical protein